MIKWLVKKVLKEEIEELAHDFYCANKEEILAAIAKQYNIHDIASHVVYALEWNKDAREALIESFNKHSSFIVGLVEEINNYQLRK